MHAKSFHLYVIYSLTQAFCCIVCDIQRVWVVNGWYWRTRWAASLIHLFRALLKQQQPCLLVILYIFNTHTLSCNFMNCACEMYWFFGQGNGRHPLQPRPVISWNNSITVHSYSFPHNRWVAHFSASSRLTSVASITRGGCLHTHKGVQHRGGVLHSSKQRH